MLFNVDCDNACNQLLACQGVFDFSFPPTYMEKATEYSLLHEKDRGPLVCPGHSLTNYYTQLLSDLYLLNKNCAMHILQPNIWYRYDINKCLGLSNNMQQSPKV